MAASPGSTITDRFATLTDPRIGHTKRHQLLDSLALALCAIICGADEWVAMEEFGNAKREWFDTFLALPNGIPPHDTFGRLFAALDPDQFQSCFLAWVQQTMRLTEGAVIACDGKTVRRSHDRGTGKGTVHMVSAWASAQHLVLGQRAVEEKSNEITALPALLELLMLKGCIVTIDAMDCQTEIAQTIIDREADYVLALKENHDTIYHEIVNLFADAQATNFANYDADGAAETADDGHGRVEIRRYWTISDPATGRAVRAHWGLRMASIGSWTSPFGRRKAGRGRG